MSVTEFIESMRRKQRQNSITNITPQINNSVKNDSRSTNENQYTNIVFFTEEKLTTNVKRRYESQVTKYFQYTSLFHNCLFIIFVLSRFQMLYLKRYKNFHQKYVLKY